MFWGHEEKGVVKQVVFLAVFVVFTLDKPVHHCEGLENDMYMCVYVCVCVCVCMVYLCMGRREGIIQVHWLHLENEYVFTSI